MSRCGNGASDGFGRMELWYHKTQYQLATKPWDINTGRATDRQATEKECCWKGLPPSSEGGFEKGTNENYGNILYYHTIYTHNSHSTVAKMSWGMLCLCYTLLLLEKFEVDLFSLLMWNTFQRNERAWWIPFNTWEQLSIYIIVLASIQSCMKTYF